VNEHPRSSHSFRNECSPVLLSDDALVARLRALVEQERVATTALILALGEFDRRKLYLSQGCSSLFTYCTQVLHLSEHAAYNRIEAARTAARFPVVIDGLEDGSLTLTAIRLLSPILTRENHSRLVGEARYKCKRDVERLVATERPQPDAPDAVRKQRQRQIFATAVVEKSDATSTTSPRIVAALQTPKPAVTTPLTNERYRIQFSASKSVEEKLRRAQALLRHTIPGGQIDAIIERALDVLLASLEKKKWGSTANANPRPRVTAGGSRHIPAAVKREVWKRDAGRCAFVGSLGRCTEEAFLEFHHVIPFADGGAATTANIELRCRSHNAYEADRHFGLLPLQQE
jgi:hypothetical protein